MGRDGAQGLLTLRKLGWRTIAQDQSTSIVWGMPKAAIEIGAAEITLPLPRIAEAIARIVRERTQPRRDGPSSNVGQGSPAWQR
jgi:chemotaxis response regulator CheB